MTPEEQKQADFTLEAEWRQSLPEVYRPIAERYGKDEFIIAYAIGSVNEALGLIGKMARGNETVRKAIFFAVSGANNLATYALIGKGMDVARLAEIQRDIERAAALSGATAVDGKGRIIVPS